MLAPGSPDPAMIPGEVSAASFSNEMEWMRVETGSNIISHQAGPPRHSPPKLCLYATCSTGIHSLSHSSRWLVLEAFSKPTEHLIPHLRNLKFRCDLKTKQKLEGKKSLSLTNMKEAHLLDGEKEGGRRALCRLQLLDHQR